MRRSDPRPLCRATNRKGLPCGNPAVAGHWRCKFHGGLSTGPRRRFAVTEAQLAEKAERDAARSERMLAGRLRWLAGLKARGEKAPWGRKPKGFDRLAWSLDAIARKRAKADRFKKEAPYRRIQRDCAAEAALRAADDAQLAERRRAARENLRRLDPAPLPGETWEDSAARYACVVEQMRRDPARFWREKDEMAALARAAPDCGEKGVGDCGEKGAVERAGALL